MVERHSVEFTDKDEAQKLEFFEGDVHLGHYDFRFDFNDKKFFSISADGTVNLRIHSEPKIAKVWLLVEDDDLRPLELEMYAETDRFKFWDLNFNFRTTVSKFSFAAQTEDELNIYFGTSGVANFISPSEKWIYSSDDFPRHTIPDWVYGGVMYQIFPERFRNGNDEITPENAIPWESTPTRLDFHGGDLHGVTEKIDYIKDLGVNIIYLNPIFLSSSTHKYDAWDHFKVDDTFGGDEALKDLINEAHSRNMKVVLDCSLNHVHPRHFAFQDIVEKGEESEYKDWFTVFDYPVRFLHRPHLYANTYKVGWDGNSEEYKTYLEKTFKETKVPVEVVDDDGPIIEPTFKAWWGVPDMPKVNFKSEGARQWALDVTEHWIKNFDIDGWRMDVAKELDFSFWKDFRDVAYSAKKDILLISEIFGDTSQWLQGERFDGTMNYSFRETMTDYFATKRIDNKEFANSLANLYSMYSFEALSSCQNLLSSHDVKRFLNRCGANTDGMFGAVFLQATFPGIAGIYYGDEIGLGGADDPQNREPFPWESEDKWNKDLLKFTSELMSIKTSQPILRYGNFEMVTYDDNYVIFRRVLNDESLLCIVNRDLKNKDIELNTNAHSVDIVYGDCNIELDSGKLKITDIADNFGLIIKES
jgi:cyclomaltodextrinase